MSNTRKIKKIYQSNPTLEGAGVHLKRVFGFREENTFDPFLLLDDFHSDNPRDYIQGFPWHPHRGMETITYMLHGDVEHGDSMGNQGIISSGDVQWMTAGSGIIHQEMPKGNERGLLWGFQLWANLPANHKMMPPRYQEIKNKQIPILALASGIQIKIICGKVHGKEGPVRDIVIDPLYLDISLPANTIERLPLNTGHTAFAYMIQGKAFFCPEKKPFSHEIIKNNYSDLGQEPFVRNEHLVLFGDGDEIYMETEDTPARFLLISGKPIKEPIAWYGPIVMNTQQELQVAFEEYQNGTFIKK
jgi:hypothetical protein